MKALTFTCSNGHEFFGYDRILACPFVVDSRPCEGEVRQVSGPGAKAAKS